MATIGCTVSASGLASGISIRVHTQVIWNVCPYKYLQVDKAEQIHCHFLIPRQIIPFCSRVQSETRPVIASCRG